MTTQISELIGQRLVTKLEADLITAIAGEAIEAGSEKAGLVRQGMLQDNPEKYRISILVHPGMDPDDDNWKDISVAFQEMQLERRVLSPPAFEIGGPYGGSSWYRRGVIEWQLFATKTKEGRDTARETAFSIQGRVERAIAQANYGNLTDDFGETLVLPGKPIWSRIEPGGGPRGSYIWRGRIGYQCMTARSY